ncbi:unnamed protein product [Danaus chrysippus]|uniref:(African queen) hypothetical protein n=1 Tax=Danaus chrysippus TaxID=151541 RepID=A0A8J2W9E7_9NEOP|nr:unnamed protein product [Danaus chrysippus]
MKCSIGREVVRGHVVREAPVLSGAARGGLGAAAALTVDARKPTATSCVRRTPSASLSPVTTLRTLPLLTLPSNLYLNISSRGFVSIERREFLSLTPSQRKILRISF